MAFPPIKARPEATRYQQDYRMCSSQGLVPAIRSNEYPHSLYFLSLSSLISHLVDLQTTSVLVTSCTLLLY